MGKNFKKVEPKKTTRINQTGDSVKKNSSTDELNPAFCFQYLHRDYCIESLDKDNKCALIDQIQRLSKLTWLDIKQSHRHGLGTEKIEQNSIKEPLPDVVTPDVDLLAIRYNGKRPIVGFRENRVFHLLFIDHNFTVYNH